MLTLMLLAGLLAGWLLFAIFSAVLAESKHRSIIGWGAVGFFFGPFGLLVAALPPVAQPIRQNAPPAQTRACPECREPIQYDARVCKHCGLRYPYLPEPARTQVAVIAELHRQGRSALEIIAELDGHGVRPIVGETWTTEMIAAIVRDHVV
jgi:hypothetical protein